MQSFKTRQMKFKGLEKITPGEAVKGFKFGKVVTMYNKAKRDIVKNNHKLRYAPLYTPKPADKPSPT